MIQVQNLSMSFGERILFDEVSFTINKGERIGIVGRNGTGKSTLFKILMKELSADSGQVDQPKHYRMGYLSQHLKFDHPTILDEVSSVLPEMEGGWKEIYKAEAYLSGLGFSESDFERAPSEFSGGYQIRLNLAKLLLEEPDMLLMDEPTNYLDLPSIRWLEKFLNNWSGELLLITHDRRFMNLVSTHTLGLHRSKFRKVKGPVAKWQEEIVAEEEIFLKTQENEAKKRADLERFVERFKAKASKAKAAQSRVKMLDKMKPQEQLTFDKDLDFEFPYSEMSAKRVAQVDELSFGYDGHLELFHGLEARIGKGDRIGIIGPNGRGKSTLLRLIIGDLTPTQGSVELNDQAKVGYFGQTHIQRLIHTNTIEQEVLRCLPEHNLTKARNLAGCMLFEGDDALKKIEVLSGGEKSRVLIAQLLATPNNLLILDEPTNHLDMESIDSLTESLHAYPGTVMIVSHSEELLSQVCNRLFIFDTDDAGHQTLDVFEGPYSEFLEKGGWGKGTSKSKAKSKNSFSNAQQGHASKKASATDAQPQSTSPSDPGTPPQESKVSSKEARQAKAEFNKRKRNLLRDLLNQQDKLEKSIESLDNKIKTLNLELVKASEGGDAGEIQRASTLLAQSEKSLEESYESLDQVMKQLDESEIKLQKEFNI